MPTDKEQLDNGKTMAEMWEGFKAQTMAPDCGAQQVMDMQGAYYGGALSLFNWFMVQLDEDEEPTDQDMCKVEKMQNELHAYFNSVMVLRRPH